MSFLKSLIRTKFHSDANHTESLHRCLSAFDLTLMGIGAVIGAGIFVLTGVAAATKAGPAVMLSFVLAGFACALAAMAYAELSASIGGCGSAYGYAYASLGELLAWVIGWELILEYGVACPTVAIGWSAYVNDILRAVGLHLPRYLLHAPEVGGWINLPAFLLMLVITGLVALGVKESVRFNNIIVAVKLIVIAIFIYVASRHFQVSNWHPFLPFGWHGVVGGAGLVFFAYIGFDAVSTAAEEAKNPQRDLPIGIICSLVVCTLAYIVVSGLLTGIASYTTLNTPSPVSSSLLDLGFPTIAAIIAFGAVAGLTTVIIVCFYGLTRVILAISRDGLLPIQLSRIHPKTKTPVATVLVCGGIMSLLAGFASIGTVASLVNIGTLSAFLIVCVGVVILRRTTPNLHRPFKMPLSPWLPLLGALLCFYLMLSLPTRTWISFLIWSIIGLFVYFCYGRKRSILSKEDE